MKDQEVRRRLRRVSDTVDEHWRRLSEIEIKLQGQRIITYELPPYLEHKPPTFTNEEWERRKTQTVDIRDLDRTIKLLLEHLGLELVHVERGESWGLKEKE